MRSSSDGIPSTSHSDPGTPERFSGGTDRRGRQIGGGGMGGGGGSDGGGPTNNEKLAHFRNLNIVGFEEASDEQIIEAYDDLVEREAQLDNVWKTEWETELTDILSVAASEQLRRLDMPKPFIDQLHHLIRMCGISVRQWDEVKGLLLFKPSRVEDLMKRMVYTVRYIGFDPSIILRKLIRFHRKGRRQPKLEYELTYDYNGETS